MAKVLDMRTAVGVADHDKIDDLCGELGDLAFRCLHRLWERVAGHDVYRTDGVLRGLTTEQIERRARWPSERTGQFVRCLLKYALLDETDAGYAIHDWVDHQPHVAETNKVSSRNSNNAKARWAKEEVAVPEPKKETSGDATRNAPLLPKAEGQALVTAVFKKECLEKVPSLPTAAPCEKDMSQVIDDLEKSWPPFELRAERPGLIRPKDVEQALRDKWPIPIDLSETAWIAEKILFEQRVDRTIVQATLVACDPQLQCDPYDASFRRFIANALYAIRKRDSHRSKAIINLAKYMRKATEYTPAEMHLNEAKLLIEKWCAERMKVKLSQPGQPQLFKDIFGLSPAMSP